jgi:hypothetical protein
MCAKAAFLGTFGGCGYGGNDDGCGRSEVFFLFDRGWGSNDDFGGGFRIFRFNFILQLSIRDSSSLFVAFLVKYDFGSFIVNKKKQIASKAMPKHSKLFSGF